MNLKDLLVSIKNKVGKSEVTNKSSNNIINSPNSTSQGNNYGIETVCGDKLTQYINNCTLIVNPKLEENNFKFLDLNIELDRIKKIPNYKYSLEAVEEYKKLIVLHFQDKIVAEDYYKILMNILNIYLNRNELYKVSEYIDKIESLNYKNEREVAKVRAIMYFNKREYDKALYSINNYEYKTDDSLEYMLKKGLQCLNKIINYKEFKKSVVDEHNNLFDELKCHNNSNLYSLIAYVAQDAYEYEDLLIFSQKAYDEGKSMDYKFKLAYAYYYYGIKESIDMDIIKHDKINYQKIIEAKKICEEIVEYATKNKEVRLFQSAMALNINLLSLIGEVNIAINNLEKLSFVDKDTELESMENRLRYLYYRDSSFKSESLNEMDILLKDAFNSLEEENYDSIIYKIEPQCWSKYKKETRLHCILLECYLGKNETDKFINHIKRLEDLGIESNLIIKIKSKYYLQNKEYSKAEELLLDSIEKYKDPESYYWILKLYYQLNDFEKFRGFIEKIFKYDTFVLEVMYKEVYSIYFEFLFQNNLCMEAKELLEKCDEDLFGTENYIIASINVHKEIGSPFSVAQELERLYIITNNHKDIFNAACEYFRCNELERCKRILLNLEARTVNEIEKVYVMLSNVAILEGKLDESYSYAEKAKEAVSYLPKSEVHSFFVNRSLRCNQQDKGVTYMTNFMEEYPKVDDWVKSIKAIEEDDNGNEVPTKEFREIMSAQIQNFNNMIELLKNGQIGIVSLSKYRGQFINEIFKWRDIYTIPININSGDVQELQKEIENEYKTIVIDAIGLYILADIDELDILNNFNEVYITYSTLEYLNNMLLSSEDVKLRNVSMYISSKFSIKVKAVNYKYYDFIDVKIADHIDSYILDSIVYARINNITYCYGDAIISLLTKEIDCRSIGIVGLVKKFNNPYTSEILIKLKENKYKFINFGYSDIYNYAKKYDFKDCDRIKCFFDIPKNADISSFILQYIVFIYAIYYKQRKSFNYFLQIYLDSINKLYKKSYYYIDISESVCNRTYNNYDINAKKNFLMNNNEFIRGITMQQGAVIALRTLCYLFETDEEIQYYYNFIKKSVNREVFEKVLNVKDDDNHKYKDALKKLIETL